MARGDRRSGRGHGRGARQKGQPSEKAETPQLDEQQRAQAEALLAEVAALAQALGAAVPLGRAALLEILAPLRAAPEPVALAVALRLGDIHGVDASDAAVVAQALGELDGRRDVAREARRSRLRLRSAGVVSALPLAFPASQPVSTHSVLPSSPAPAAPTPAPEPVGERVSAAPRLVEAYATRTREQGEVVLVLGWQEGRDADFVRGYTFELSFWSDGVKAFALLEPMRRTHFLAETIEALRAERVEVVPVTWAQARRLVIEAIDVNAWRGTEPDAEFTRHHKQIAARLLDEPETAEGKAELETEAERYAREGDRHLVGANLEADEVLVHWLGAWSFGDFPLTYDLLADDHALRRTQTREEHVRLRRQWWQEADPAGLRVTLAREQEQRASALWVPGTTGVIGASAKKEFEAFWSLVLHEAAAGGQLDELPLATLTSKETGRHWYWTGYTLSRNPRWGLWLISRTRDEGGASQALSIEELQQRITEAHKTIEQLTSQPPPRPGSDEAAEALRAITGAITAALHYSDALLVRLPLDEHIYREAINDARGIGNHERAAALLEKMQGRFANDVQVRFELGVEQYLVAEQYGQQGQAAARATWLGHAVETLTAVVEAERTAEHLQGLGEILAQQGRFQQAEARLREAIALDPNRALLYSDLADTLMSRIMGEDLDDPSPPTSEARRELASQALAALRDAGQRDTAIPGLFTRMGAIYDVLQQPEDAVIALEEAIRRDPGDSEAHFALGSLFLARNQPARALGPLETAVQLAPLAITYRLHLAACYGELGRRAEARRELDLIERVQPGLPQVAELRAMLAQQEKRR
jgi:tetratricopeptide (TPR) repeat protein